MCKIAWDLRSRGRLKERTDNGIAISPWPKLVSANAHNSVTDHHHFANRSTANVAVQLRLGLLSNRRVRTHPVDRPNPLAAGADLTTASPIFSRALVGSALFSGIAQINTIMRFFDLNVLTQHTFLHRRGATVI